MAVLSAITLAAFLLEHNHLLSLHERNQYFTIHFRTFYGRRADLNVAVGFYKKNLVECNCVTLFKVFAEVVDIKEFSLFSFKLLSFDFYNSVHYYIYN